MKKSLLRAGLLLTIVVMIDGHNRLAAPANTLKPKKTPLPTGTDVESTEVTPVPRGNSEAHRNNNSNSDRNNQKNFRGLVVSSSDTSLTVELKDGSQQEFTLDENTVIKYPTHFIPQPSERQLPLKPPRPPQQKLQLKPLPPPRQWLLVLWMGCR